MDREAGILFYIASQLQRPYYVVYMIALGAQVCRSRKLAPCRTLGACAAVGLLSVPHCQFLAHAFGLNVLVSKRWARGLFALGLGDTAPL